jgi:hypothetical protein
LNWIAAASMAQSQRAEWANLHLAARLHAARTIGKVSCQRKRPEAAARIERNLPFDNWMPLAFCHRSPDADYHADSVNVLNVLLKIGCV